MGIKVYWLKDLATGSTDAVIFATKSTAEEISTCIQKMKEDTNYDWQWDDLVKCLPEDCEIYDIWANPDVVYY